MASLLEEREQTQEIVAAMSDGILVLDDAGRVLRANNAASRLLGPSGGIQEGTRLVDTVRSFPALPLLDRAAEGGSFAQAVELPGPLHLAVQVIPLPADQGRPRVLFILRDETGRVQTERMRTDFVANLSHELKTPLARLSLLTSTLGHAVDESPEDARDFISRLEGEVENLNNLVQDLLTLSRVEERAARSGLYHRASGQPESAALQSLDLAEVARRAVTSLESAYHEAKIALSTDLQPVTVRGDAIELETAVRNLLDNACRYSDPGGQVRLRVARRRDEAVLEVRDQGVGIPRDARQRIFERFYRVDRARSRETGGTGLGLSIVRNIVEQHGGKVQVESSVGVGSSFTIRLPLAPDD
jgi:two-component system, OmpR family, phosphate regulon sensor histidine kinase PhoR